MNHLTSENLHAALVEHLAKLEAVGSDDQIALHYQDQLVRAHCGNAFKCAVAQDVSTTLTEKLGVDVIAMVGVGTTMIWLGDGFPGVIPATVVNPPVVSAFITRFDGHQYPELIADAEAA